MPALRKMKDLQQTSPLTRDLPLFLLLVFLFMMDRDPVSRLGWGEMTTLPWGFQFLTPEWMPNSWLFNLPLGSQLLTGILAGTLVQAFGFLGASVVGRLLLYALLAFSLGSLSRRLGIPGSFTLIAILGYAVLGQSIGAGEWIIRDFEAKSIAYGFVLLGLSFWLAERPGATGACFGVATSFHFLVGGWSFAALLAVQLADRADRRAIPREVGFFLPVATVGIFNIAYEVIASWNAPQVSHIIARFRIAHHVVPAYFQPHWQFRLVILLLAWAALWWWTGLPRQARKVARFAAATAALFVAGLAIEPFDPEGRFLQLYPFRTGDALFPLLTLLLLYFAFERGLSPRVRNGALSAIGPAILIFAGVTFAVSVSRAAKTPAEAVDWVEMCRWIDDGTSTSDIVIVPPGTDNFAVMARRPTVAAFRQFPFQRNDVLEWRDRMRNLTAGDLDTSAAGLAAISELDARYRRLTLGQIRALQRRYRARYFLTRCEHELEMRRVHASGQFCLFE